MALRYKEPLFSMACSYACPALGTWPKMVFHPESNHRTTEIENFREAKN
jgi:hypothetical protein